jgi:hypothetical protein
MKALTPPRKAESLALRDKMDRVGWQGFAEGEKQQWTLLTKTTSLLHDPTFCAEPEVFLGLRRKCQANPSQTRKLSMVGLSTEMEGGVIRIKRFCSNCVFAKRAIERHWKEIVDQGRDMYNVGIMHDMVGYGLLALDVIIDSYDSTNYNREARISRRTTFPGGDDVFDMVGKRGGEGRPRRIQVRVRSHELKIEIH